MRAPLLGLSQRCTATYLRTIAFGAGSAVGVALLSQHRAGLETAVVVGTTLGLLGSLLLRTSAGASRAKGPRAGVPRSRDEYRGVSFERPPGAFSREATEQRQTAASLGESEDRYRDLFENATAPIATLGLDDRITEVNDAFARLLGYRPDEMVGTHLNSYLMPTEIGVAESQLERKLSGEAATTGYEQQFVSRTGRRIILEVETRLLYRDGVATGTQGICHDITAQREAETELRQLAELNHRLATYDALTGLPNRASFHRAVTDAIAVPGSHAVVLHLDVDRFKQVNDTLGHESGDRLLTKIATCLRDGLDDRAVLARLAGDEFGILITGDAATIDAICDETVTRLEANLREPLLVQGLPLLVEASIGIARHPADGLTADLLLQRADIAVDQAKKDAHGHAYFRLEASPADTGRLQLLSELRRALDERELVVHYQPKIDLVSGGVRRVEALVRWQHPTRGLVPPNDFVEAAEQTSLIGPLTLYVVESAIEEVVRLRHAGIDVDVAVNLSARNLG
ncbi:MAG TPA: diguanylate cyclase, partial [Gaiellaceae bacterium]